MTIPPAPAPVPQPPSEASEASVAAELIGWFHPASRRFIYADQKTPRTTEQFKGYTVPVYAGYQDRFITAAAEQAVAKVTAERDRYYFTLVGALASGHFDKLTCKELREPGEKLQAQLASALAEVEIAQRDAGLYAATLTLSARALGCEAHMVDHEVKAVLARLATAERERAELAKGLALVDAHIGLDEYGSARRLIEELLSRLTPDKPTTL